MGTGALGINSSSRPRVSLEMEPLLPTIWSHEQPQAALSPVQRSQGFDSLRENRLWALRSLLAPSLPPNCSVLSNTSCNGSVCLGFLWAQTLNSSVLSVYYYIVFSMFSWLLFLLYESPSHCCLLNMFLEHRGKVL